MSYISINCILGELYITEHNEKISAVSLTKPDCVCEATPLLSNAALQLSEYFDKKRTVFDLPLEFAGTEFYNSVWKALCEIPYGKTCSYGDIAQKVGRPKAARAVGMANHNNPIMIIVPCHRVIGASGALTGYAGGVHIKKALLELEQANDI